MAPAGDLNRMQGGLTTPIRANVAVWQPCPVVRHATWRVRLAVGAVLESAPLLTRAAASHPSTLVVGSGRFNRTHLPAPVAVAPLQTDAAVAADTDEAAVGLVGLAARTDMITEKAPQPHFAPPRISPFGDN